jgi:hypothetical protein
VVRTLIVGAAAVAALLPAQAPAQTEAGLSVYSQGHLKGFRTIISGPAKYKKPLVVRSLVAPAGTEWELCSGLTYTGCRQVKGSVPTMVMTVRSVRPVAAMLPSSAELPSSAGLSPGRTVAGRSLRGIKSEFFVSPDGREGRIEVVPGTAEAMARRAGEFCRSRGWRSSPYGRMQAVEGRAFLADVLCVDD